MNKVHAELTKLLGIGDVSKAEVAEDGVRQSKLIATFGERLSGYFRANHSSNRRRRFVNGYSLHAYSEGFFVDELSVIDMHPGLADLVDFINTIANAPFVFLPVLLGFSATRKFGGNPFLGGSAWDVISSPSLADGWNYALTLAQGKIQYWNVFGLEIEKSAIKVPLSQH